MKKILTLALALISLGAYSQQPNYKYIDATDLTIVGKLMPGQTSNPYHRVDTSKYHGMTPREQVLVMTSSGMACAFRTNSTRIAVKTTFGHRDEVLNGNMIAARGYDLYIKKDGKWLYAGSGTNAEKNLDKPATIVKNMDGSYHDCLLYFPLYSEETSIKIAVLDTAKIEASPIPFHHRIVFWGSSFTHGSSTTRSGMSYPAQFARNTGLQSVSLGMSGRCLLQDYMADVLVDVKADAFIFDSFSNPRANVIEERMMPFIDKMIAAHPGVPMIFQQTIYREGRHFDVAEDKKEQEKMDVVEKLFKQMKSTKEGKLKYKDVYLIYPDTNSDGPDNTVDGVHPDNHGYTLWAKSIEKPILKILAKYGIK